MSQADVPEQAETDESRFVVDGELVGEVVEALRYGDTRALGELLTDIHAADMADLLQLLKPIDRRRLVIALGNRFEPEILSYLDPVVREEIIDTLGPRRAGQILAELEVDDAVNVLGQLGEGEQMRLLAAMPQDDRSLLEQGLAYPEYTAGRLMQRELVAVPQYWTVGQAIDFLRSNADLPDEFYDLFIVDPRFKPVGMIPLSNVLRNRRDVPLGKLALKDLQPIEVHTDQEDVAFAFRQYDLTSAPVVDQTGRLLGVITIDDVVDVIEEEAEDDLLKLGGVSETDIFDRPVVTARKRFPWLIVNLITAIVASLVIAQFDDTIEVVVALAVLMPMVASMGGNAGTQTMTVVVRSLATKEVTMANAFRVLIKELIVGIMNGGLFLVIGAVIAIIWVGSPLIAGLFGLALIVNMVVAALAGVIIPVTLERLGQDPAVSSGIFLTTVTDVTGFFVFLGLATVYLL